MYKIFQVIEIRKPAEDIYYAISTIEGLAGWWTKDTTGNPAIGGEIRFGFGEHFNIMKVSELLVNKFVKWEVLSSNFPSGKEWIGTIITFTLEEHEDGITEVKFEHSNWKEATEFFEICSFHWGVSLVSLKLLCATGSGAPD